MRQIALGLCLLTGVFTISVSAQRATPTPVNGADTQDVVKISTKLVQLDFTATDAKGDPITDLRPEEVHVRRNGVAQKVTSLSFISASRPVEKPAGAASRTAGDNSPAPLRASQVRRTLIFLLDDYTLSVTSIRDAKNALQKYLDQEMQPGDLVAIARLSAGAGVLQQLTTDKAALSAAVDNLKWDPLGIGGAVPLPPIEPDIQTGSDDSAKQVTAVLGTVNTLRFIDDQLAVLPGRKSIVLFSDGFALMYPKTDQPLPNTDEVTAAVDRMIVSATRASVVINTIDARGLLYTGLQAADGIPEVNPFAMASPNLKTLNQSALTSVRNIVDARVHAVFATQGGLDYVAKQTGGQAIRNTNDLSIGVREILQDQSYYLVAFEPSEDDVSAATAHNKIEISVDRSNAAIRYRKDYGVAVKPKTSTPDLEALLASPYAVENIHLKLSGSVFRDSLAPVIRSAVHIDARDLKFADTPDGGHKGSFEVLAIAFDSDGVPKETVSKSYEFTINAGAFPAALKNGITYRFDVPIHTPGVYNYRVAIKDNHGGEIGTDRAIVQVPDLKQSPFDVSGVILRGLTMDEWQHKAQTDSLGGAFPDEGASAVKPGSVLNYYFEIYAPAEDGKRTDFTSRVRILKDGIAMLNGKPTAAASTAAASPVAGALLIPENMAPGRYTIEVSVAAKSGPTDAAPVVRSRSFEIVR